MSDTNEGGPCPQAVPPQASQVRGPGVGEVLGQTRLARACRATDPGTHEVNVGICTSTTFRMSSFERPEGSWCYARSANPTRAEAERVVAELEGGAGAAAFSSGMAALDAVLTLLSQGDEVVVPPSFYAGTHRLLDSVFSRFGVGLVTARDLSCDSVRDALGSRGRLVLVESPTNPLYEVADIAGLARVAHEAGALLCVDNTLMTPWFQRPLGLGADLVVHSATKFLAGHNDVTAGVVAWADERVGERVRLVQNGVGAVLDPFGSYLLVRGIKTLGLRMERQAAGARELALSLLGTPGVSRVWYPGLPGHPGHDLQMRQAAGSGGALLSLELAPDVEPEAFFRALRLATFATSLGGTETLACHPTTDAFAELGPEGLRQMGISDRLVRLSVGIEDPKDILDDLTAALAAARRR